MHGALRVTPLLLLTAAAVACRSHTTATPPMPGTVASTPAEHAILRVQISDAGSAFGFFPSHPGAATCVIQGGGPGPGLRVHGLCATRVLLRRAAATVVFTERWPWRAFHYSGTPRRPQHHSWRFVVRPSGKVVVAANVGDFPPQFVR
jgi:hypothetical protein